MRLINASNLELEFFSGDEEPPYAILSHTWFDDKDEVTFQEFQDPSLRSELRDRPGFMKIEKVCELARSLYKLNYVWVDTCAVDKTSSAELSEAINSMFAWYKNAEICIAYLSDVDIDEPTDDESPYDPIVACKWLTRGWTLQELVAPRMLDLHDKHWRLIGSKDDAQLASELSSACGIDVDVLLNRQQLSDVPIALRMSWAAKRVTKRPEDRAYSLLGIFDVNMPLLYGEGATKAFIRLQEEIIKNNPDLSIFLWPAEAAGTRYMGIMATSPSFFGGLKEYEVSLLENASTTEHSITNRGLKMTSALSYDPDTGCFALPTQLRDNLRGYSITVVLRQIGPGNFVRVLWDSTDPKLVPGRFESSFIIDSTIREFRIVKTLPFNEAIRLESLELQLQTSTPNEFGTCVSDPIGCYDPIKRRLLPEFENSSYCFLIFEPPWADDFDSFVVVCRHIGNAKHPWQVAMLAGDDWRGRQQWLHQVHEASFSNGVSRLILSHFFIANASKVVSASLDRDEKTGQRILSLEISQYSDPGLHASWEDMKEPPQSPPKLRLPKTFQEWREREFAHR